MFVVHVLVMIPRTCENPLIMVLLVAPMMASLVFSLLQGLTAPELWLNRTLMHAQVSLLL